MADFNEEETEAIIAWIEEVTGDVMQGDIISVLSSGVQLCKLVNYIQPGLIQNINTTPIMFAKVENLKAFFHACLQLGVDGSCLLEISDFSHEGGDGLPSILANIVALARIAKVRGLIHPKIDLREPVASEVKDEDIEISPRLKSKELKHETETPDLLGQINTLKRQLHFAAQESRVALEVKVRDKDVEINRLKMKLEERESALSELNQKHNLVSIDLQVIRRDNDFLLQREKDLLSVIEELKRERSVLVASKRKSDSRIYNLSDEKDRRKFIESQKKELKKLKRKEKEEEKEREKEEKKEEKEREKEEKKEEKGREKEREREEREKEKDTEADERPNKLTQRLRSFTVSKLHDKEKERIALHKELFVKDSEMIASKMPKLNLSFNGHTETNGDTKPDAPQDERKQPLRSRSTTERFLSMIKPGKKEDNKKEDNPSSSNRKSPSPTEGRNS